MTSFLRPLAVLAGLCLAVAIPGARAADTASLDAQGYIRDWLMLAPIPLPEGAPASEMILRNQVREEGSLKPSAGDKATALGRELTWTRVTATTNAFDFNATLKSMNDQAAGYLVTYIECDADIPGVIVAVGSSDQARLHFNGVDIYAVTEARPMMLDTDKGRITLRKGVNTIVFKVINEQNAWMGAIRLLDKSGAPLQGVRIKTQP